MAYKTCLLAFTKDFSKTSTPTKGDEVTVTANAILHIPEPVVDYFNIPTVELTAIQEDIVKSYTFKMYKYFSDTTGTDVTVPENGTNKGGLSSDRTVRLKQL